MNVKTMVNAFIYLNVSSPADLKWQLNNLIDTIRPQKNLICSIGHKFDFEYTFNDIVCFQITYFTEKNMYNIISNQYIPEEIVLNSEIYILKSIVYFRTPQLKASIGHYQAFCRRTLGNWEVYTTIRATTFYIGLIYFATFNNFVFWGHTRHFVALFL